MAGKNSEWEVAVLGENVQSPLCETLCGLKQIPLWALISEEMGKPARLGFLQG